MNYMDQYKFWLEDSYFDEGTKEELRKIADNQAEIEDRFYKDLAFGTGGLRGVIGAGTNRMNIYTVRKATQGLANYILKQGGADKGVAIAYDSRYYSPEFADEAALCMAANGIKAYVFDELRPTPELSFALRTLGCISGIVVTASHNPPEYNGYKVYWEDGAQVTAPKDHEIIDEVEHVTDFHTVKTMSKDDAIEAGLYQYIGEEIDVAYMEELKKQIIHPEIIKEVADELKIVYTPFHGTGNKPVRRILAELGFKHVYVVPEQERPDPAFTTLDYPNPEDPKAFTLALKLAKKVDADIVLATDPDADRVGIAMKCPDGSYELVTGNEMGVLIGKRGQTLDSLQYLVSLVVNKESEEYIHVKVDTENYRQRRKETLENLAKNIAYKVKRTKRSVSLEPMNPYERRIIHSALQNDKYVTTHSEGEEPFRRVVVTLKR